MAPLHMAVESNRIKMVKCLLDQGADIDIQDDNEVILHTNAVDYSVLNGWHCTHCSFFLLFENKILSLQASKLGTDLWLWWLPNFTHHQKQKFENNSLSRIQTPKILVIASCT